MTPATAPLRTWPGSHEPLGASWREERTNFAVFSPDSSAVEVCLFDEAGVETRYALTEQTLGTWHGAVPGVKLGQRYGYRVDGVWDPAGGFVFNPAKVLVDPYARAISGDLVYDDAIYGFAVHGAVTQRSESDSAGLVPLSVVVSGDFDWEGDRHPRTRWTDTVVYEMHVKGFSQLNPAIPAKLRGTYAGLGHPASIDYLTDLGVTAVELLPCHQFVTEPVVAARSRVNYWGYNTLNWFAPHHAYSASGDRGGQVDEFKQMVKALHAAGIEVLLDVVYNHTAEGGYDGPTLSLRGLDDRGYYMRADLAQDPAKYLDLTGCGNTFDASYPPALRMILDSLRYWVNEMHVDGFRFDLTSALTRTGTKMDLRADFLQAISQDPVLRRVKLIAEPWDISFDGYQVGNFPPPWVEWNDQYRDTIRDFWRAQSGGIRTVTTRLSGSSDLYADDGRSPYASVNFVTAHDGFTLRDLVSYNEKHNEANGEDNRDGSGHNRSWNCGVEGETTDPEIVDLRQRQAANLMITLCLSTGVPMITMGDERGRSQGGNNNGYAQDNAITWMAWDDEGDHDWSTHMLGVTREALRLRHRHPALRQRHYLEGRPAADGGLPDLAWIHPSGRIMTIDDWHDAGLHAFGMFVSGDPLRAPGPRGEVLHDLSFLIWFNAHPEPGKVNLMTNRWLTRGEVVLSTCRRHPAGTLVESGTTIDIEPHSILVLRNL